VWDEQIIAKMYTDNMAYPGKYLPSLARVQRVTKLPHRAIANSRSASCRPEHMSPFVSSTNQGMPIYSDIYPRF
jgi:hypothetical protein